MIQGSWAGDTEARFKNTRMTTEFHKLVELTGGMKDRVHDDESISLNRNSVIDSCFVTLIFSMGTWQVEMEDGRWQKTGGRNGAGLGGWLFILKNLSASVAILPAFPEISKRR